MYADILKVMDGARTLKEHITKLQAILDLPPVDPQLASALRRTITSLTQDQYNANKQGVASQKVQLNPTTTTVYRQLYSYCQQHVTAGTPEWMVAALQAGWTPPSTP